MVMGGFIYNSHTQGAYNIDVMRFDDFPDWITPNGENPNLTLRSYLTTADGECVPMYEFIGDESQWTQTLLNAEQAAPGDGNVFKLVSEGISSNGNLLLSFGELVVEDNSANPAHKDGYFEGVSYDEIMSALREAGYNKHEDIKPQSPCSNYASTEIKSEATLQTNKTI
jgi:hypothetical protein